MLKVFRRQSDNRMRTTSKLAPVAEYLGRVDIFKDLSREEIEALFTGVMLRECVPGTVFFTPEDASERLFILKEGSVLLYRLTPSGKRLVTRRIGPGTVFGEMGLLGQSMESCYAETTENSLVCVATKENMLVLLGRRPDVALRLLEGLANRLMALEERLEQAAFSPVRVRLGNFLLANADPVTGLVSGYTHEEIGDVIGASRQTVTETVNQMSAEAIVAVRQRRIQVLNRQRLEELTSS